VPLGRGLGSRSRHAASGVNHDGPDADYGEPSPGPSARIHDTLWEQARQYSGQGRALPAHTTNNEKGFTLRTHDHAWHPTDCEGATLIRRSNPTAPTLNPAPDADPPTGWSRASKRRRFGKR
jgi:CRISPR-associated protein Cas2